MFHRIVITTIILGVVMGTTCAFSTRGKPWSVVQADIEAKEWRKGGRIPYHGSNEDDSSESYEHDSEETHADDSHESHGPYNEETYAYHGRESLESEEVNKDAGYYINKRIGHVGNHGQAPHP
ncbi:uncharacterized protein LOC125034484 [Penaeus chinensis]|uniref:uncharacterized protein LOC125034484 n=1 Tax=Penaeus chinensis TaxID=139456 RepID=UPI001FB74B7D|nr:uncharacterized protein LOC125034484 [Penaeus chinensis]